MTRERAVTLICAGVLLGASTSWAREGQRSGAGAGRPYATWTSLSATVDGRGRPRPDQPVFARTDAYYRLAPAPAGGVLELRLPHEKMRVTRAFGEGRELKTSVKGGRLLVEAPRDGRLVLSTAIASGPGRPVRFETGQVRIGDLAATLQAGGRTVGKPPHFRTGRPQPEVGEHVVRFAGRGWEVTRANMPRSTTDYVHPLQETVQAHFAGPPDKPFGATATYTGRVNGKAAEGVRARVRRGTRRMLNDLGILAIHALEIH